MLSDPREAIARGGPQFGYSAGEGGLAYTLFLASFPRRRDLKKK
ncbi:hypothetical protein KSS87_002714 [Heliosperma pusillum]|nr:hypothetical protein KSS87_002714 [Heliosperma pusillum]